MSYHSTLQYYEGINRIVNEKAGGMASADLVIRSVNFEQYHQWMQNGEWNEISNYLCAEAWNLAYDMRCDYIAIATNTMHKVADDINGAISGYGRQPKLVHIGDCVAEKCLKNGVKRVTLIGTKFTMMESFMKCRLRQNGLEVVDNFTESEIREINRIIFDELCHGKVTDKAVSAFLNIAYRANHRDIESGNAGFDGVILGCTELNMLVPDESIMVKPEYQSHFQFIDSTEAHIERLAELCLYGG